jgi:hypothetical protein
LAVLARLGRFGSSWSEEELVGDRGGDREEEEDLGERPGLLRSGLVDEEEEGDTGVLLRLLDELGVAPTRGNRRASARPWRLVREGKDRGERGKTAAERGLGLGRVRARLIKPRARGGREQ